MAITSVFKDPFKLPYSFNTNVEHGKFLGRFRVKLSNCIGSLKKSLIIFARHMSNSKILKVKCLPERRISIVLYSDAECEGAQDVYTSNNCCKIWT